ncbi:MAG: PAS domain S-box protein [Proteobacteria bacterium]|nr:PAS domain S-box protein [Pseudomonadota bacterium]
MTDAPFAGLLESAPDAMIVVGPDGNIVMVNGHAEALFGHDRAALIGAPVEILIPGAYHADHRAHMEAYFEHPETRPMGRNMALTGKTREGREFPVEISLGPMTTESGILVLAAVRDVTAKRHAKAETLAAKDQAATAGDQLRDAIESIAEGFVLYDAGGRLVLCNSAFRGFYGYSEVDAKPGVATYQSLGRLDELRDDDSRERCSFPESLAELRRSGTQRITETVGDRVIERRQQITAEGGIISVQSDITDRIRAEQALQGRIMFSDLLHRITVAANQANSIEGVLQFCLDEICAVTGWPVGHVYMMVEDSPNKIKSSGLWHIEESNQNAAIKRVTSKTSFIMGKGLISRVLTSGKPDWIADVSKDPRFRRGKSEKNIGVKARIAFPVLTGKNVAAILEFFAYEAIEPDAHLLDVMAQIGTQLGRVVERHAAQKALRDSEERFRFVMDHSPAAMNLKDTKGRFLLVNARFEEWYGLAAEEVIGKRAHEAFPLLDTASLVAVERQVTRLNSTRVREFETDFADGKTHLLQATKFVVNDGQGVAMGIGTIETDITEPRRIETQLRQAHKMEAVGQLTGGVAHDFNNLLAVISGNLELLDEALAGDENKRELLRWAMDAADDAASLTRDLLAFSRQQPLSPRTVRINDLVNNLLTMMRRPLGEVIDIATDLSDDLAHHGRSGAVRKRGAQSGVECARRHARWRRRHHHDRQCLAQSDRHPA